MQKIMIIEDDTAIREELGILLGHAGYETCVPERYEDGAEEVRRQTPDLILLDINLPGKSGFDICKGIRRFSKVPIIFITSRNTSMDELKALTLGGDDYVVKPYNIPVLMARIQSVMRRNQQDSDAGEVMEHNGVTLNLAVGSVAHNGKSAELTKTELKTLYFLFRNPGRIVPRADIVEFLWDNEVYIDDNTLSVNMTRIREKLKQIGISDFIRTKRGMGYMI